MKQAANFSYREKVQATKKAKMENCTPEVEDLFRQMFELDSSKRINFSDIRRHPVFAHYFPNVDETLSKIYGEGLNLIYRKKTSTLNHTHVELTDNFFKILCGGFIKMKNSLEVQ